MHDLPGRWVGEGEGGGVLSGHTLRKMEVGLMLVLFFDFSKMHIRTIKNGSSEKGRIGWEMPRLTDLGTWQ